MKLVSLLKAVLTDDMNMFKYTTKKNSSKLKKILMPLFLFVIVSVSIGVYAYMIASKLHPYHLTYIMLTMFLFVVTIITFMEGIYKSQGILFEAKDNDLLFSLPIGKSKILFVRIFKLLLFQYIYNLMFILPTFIVYIYFENPSISFYLISLFMTFLIPIIPTIISSIIGYIIKLFSSKSKRKKIVQTLLSSIVFLVIFFLSMNIESFIKDIATKALGINDLLIKIYYPIGIYINLITDFNLLDLIKLLVLNISLFYIFILLASKYYFGIISNSRNRKIKIEEIKDKSLKKNSKIVSLASKELKRYFSSPIYMFNTSFGIIIAVAMTILLIVKGVNSFNIILANYRVSEDIPIYLLYYELIFFSLAMTSITSSSISLEGRTINITKSFPLSEKTILNSKILFAFIIEVPLIILSEFIYFIAFRPSLFYIVSILLITIILIFLEAVIGLIINLKYPKMNATNDTEVVKQSMSSMISVFTGMLLFIINIVLLISLYKYITIEYIIIIEIVTLILLSIILYYVLMKYSINDYRKITV